MFKSQITYNHQETQEFAENFSRQILKNKPQNHAVVLALSGDLGAGKTTFTQGFSRGLGVTEIVNSPTFVIMKKFPLQKSLFKNFYHFDCYRLESPEEILSLNFKEIVENPENIVVIEWPEKISSLLPSESIHIKFEHQKENTRTVIIENSGTM